MFLSQEQIKDLLISYEKDTKLLKEQITELCYFMNGGLEWSSAWDMSFEDREIMTNVINKRRKEQNPDGKEYM